MSWIRRETEKGTVQYICPHCSDYHEFREDFGERTFNENFIFCRRCGARNGTGTPPNEWVSVEDAMPPELKMVLVYCGGLYDVAGWVKNEDGEVCWTCKTAPDFWRQIPEME